MKPAAFDWKRHHQASVTRLARKLHITGLKEDELRAVHWAACLPDYVAGGWGEAHGYEVKPGRPGLFDVTDETNLHASRFWSAYARQPEAVLRLMLAIRTTENRLAEAPPAWVAVREAMSTMPAEKVDVQLLQAARLLGIRHPTTGQLESLSKARKRLLRGDKRPQNLSP